MCHIIKIFGSNNERYTADFNMSGTGEAVKWVSKEHKN